MHQLRSFVYLLIFGVIGCGSDQKTPQNANASGSGGSTASTGGTASGGASAGSNGGSGMPQMPPEHVVSACPKPGLPGVAEAVWENITPSELQAAGVQAVAMDPHDFATLYLGSTMQGLYKSTDCGATWTRINTGKNGDIIGTGMLWDIVIDPIDPQVLYVINGYGSEIGLWKSVNSGVDWTQLMPKDGEIAKTVEYNFASIVSMDPKDHNHLVVTFHADCKGAFAPGCQAETKDAGATWRLMKSPSTESWEGAWPTVLDSTTWLYGLPFDGLWRTADSGATFQDITPEGATGASGQLYRKADGSLYLASLQGVLTSTDEGATWSLIPNSGSLLVGLTGNGSTMYASQQMGPEYYSASEADPTKWEKFPTKGMPDTHMRGGFNLVIDGDHHLLFSSNQTEGLWRLAIP